MSSSHGSSYPQLGSELEGDTPQVSLSLRHTTEMREAADPWRALAKFPAGRQVCRESTNGGRSYPKKGTGGLTDRLPSMLAAIPVYSNAGDTGYWSSTSMLTTGRAAAATSFPTSPDAWASRRRFPQGVTQVRPPA